MTERKSPAAGASVQSEEKYIRQTVSCRAIQANMEKNVFFQHFVVFKRYIDESR